MYNPYLHLMNQKRYMNSMKKNRSSSKRNKNCIDCDKGFNLGDPAPEFTLKGIVNGQPKDVSLSDYKGKWVVVFFYGSDFTFVWPTELAAVADAYNQFEKLNTEVLAISTDSIYSHKIFMQESPSGQKINYPLLSDRTQAVSKSYGVLNEKEGFAYRGAFIIDPDGNIQAYLVNPQVVGRNIYEILRIIQGLQYNEETGMGLPANWKPGEEGIPIGWDYVGKY